MCRGPCKVKSNSPRRGIRTLGYVDETGHSLDAQTGLELRRHGTASFSGPNDYDPFCFIQDSTIGITQVPNRFTDELTGFHGIQTRPKD